MKHWKKWLIPLVFTLVGGLLGYGYYHFFGCTNGCPIQSNPWLTTGYFGVMGLLLSVVFAPKPQKAAAKNRNN